MLYGFISTVLNIASAIYLLDIIASSFSLFLGYEGVRRYEISASEFIALMGLSFGAFIISLICNIYVLLSTNKIETKSKKKVVSVVLSSLSLTVYWSIIIILAVLRVYY